MKKIKYNFDEEVLYEKLDNGLKVYLYPSKKSKNFYATISTKFGAHVQKYKNDNTVYGVSLGSAHFLEHRVMDFTKNKKAEKLISHYGSLVNAYTTYEGTNYNIFFNDKVVNNLKLLFDAVFKANIKANDVEREKGIILEEYYMYKSDPYFILHTLIQENVFNKSYLKYPVIGTKESIENMDVKELQRLYNDFYTFNNMFVVIVGDFDVDEVMNFIKDYTNKLDNKTSKAKVIKVKDTSLVNVDYQEISLNVNIPKVSVGYKIKIDNKDRIKFKIIISMLLNELFSSTGKAYAELNDNGIAKFSTGVINDRDYILITFKSSTTKTTDFIRIVKKYYDKLNLNNESLSRKKRCYISDNILLFEDIFQVEDIITNQEFLYNKLLNNINDIINSITISDVNNAVNKLKDYSKSILICNCK